MYDSQMTHRGLKSGANREQASLLPARIEDYVGADNPVRAIEAFVAALDLAKLGFGHAERGMKVGQPPYDPADLLKLYLYGYTNRVRSSRRLEQEASRNLEVIWLLKGLTPGYRTIAKFRQDNWKALKAVNREFVLLMRQLGLFGGVLVAIDGAFFDGSASKASIKTQKRLAKQLAALDRDIESYQAALEANDTAEAARSGGDRGGGDSDGGDLQQKVEALMAKRVQTQADLKQLEASGETQLSRTDADARLLTKNGQRIAGYNVQIAVDDKHALIVASEVVNDGNDTRQLDPMATAAKEALEVETLQAVADAGYYNGLALKGCEQQNIIAYVPPPERASRLAVQGRFTQEQFVYDGETDSYRCPAAERLLRTKTPRKNGDRVENRYVSRKAVCDACPLRLRCVTDKQPTREILRWEHEEVIERHRARMQNATDMMRRRKALVEHPFGTLKCRAGYRHFLVRGFDKVRGEWSLMALCYNFTRLLSIIGFDRFMEHMAELMHRLVCLVLAVCRITAALRPVSLNLTRFYRQPAPKPELRCLTA
jgi:transposase